MEDLVGIQLLSDWQKSCATEKCQFPFKLHFDVLQDPEQCLHLNGYFKLYTVKCCIISLGKLFDFEVCKPKLEIPNDFPLQKNRFPGKHF